MAGFKADRRVVDHAEVRAATTLALLMVLGLAAAGCGATKKIVVNVNTNSLATKIANAYSPTITVNSTTATIANAKTGTFIPCKGWIGPGVEVPPAGGSAGDSEGEIAQAGTGQSSSRQIQLKHMPNGSLTISCK